MLSGWDPFVNRTDADVPNVGNNATYFSGEDDGHQVKKGWVYTVPAEEIDAKAYADDEEKYMYFNNSGDIVSDQFKKINGKYYVFNRTGIMKTGLVIWCENGTKANSSSGTSFKYVDKLDLDWATGEEISKKGIYRTDQNEIIKVNSEGIVQEGTNNANISRYEKVKLHYFGEDGARKTGMNTVEFSDDAYTINTVGGSGDKGTGVYSKKYYSLGILLKASADIRYGIYQQATASMLKAQNPDNGGDYYQDLEQGMYLVLTTSGSKQKGNNTAKKDADGNYWMIDAKDSSLKGIYSVGIKELNTLNSFTTKTVGERLIYDESDEKMKTVNKGLNNEYKAVTTEKLSEKFPELFVSDAVADMGNVWWIIHETGTTDSYYTLEKEYNGPCFQSDYGDGTNKWIPFGMKDNALKSATFRWVGYQDEASVAYAIKPTNDYFLNCYWN